MAHELKYLKREHEEHKSIIRNLNEEAVKMAQTYAVILKNQRKDQIISKLRDKVEIELCFEGYPRSKSFIDCMGNSYRRLPS